ncbi:MAG: hypothetical protein CMB87_04600 [Flammeovirgaceae bacterium]|nr:hypothetical protein [Flammeovirgaceae bacterium]|tara:strand:- start:1148 stop:2374 length:1227 start_codon:yes stop_codon:yes gene_type:complete
MITNDAVIFGILFSILGLVFLTYNSTSSFWKNFYTFFPVILVCYFLPSFLNTTGIINSDNSNLYYVASRYLLPCSLVLLTISVDLKEIIKLGPKALIMFFTGTLGILLGGPFALFTIKFFFPDILNIEIKELANGMTTIAGSWIGGGANQAAMMEVFNVDSTLFSKMVAVDIICANVLLAFLLVGVNNSKSIDKRLNADSSSIEEIKNRIENYNRSIMKIPDLKDLIFILSVGFGVTGFSHFFGDILSSLILNNYPFLEKYSLGSKFFWLVIISTSLGILLSFTKLRKLEGAGSSKIGGLFIYILVLTIGLKMDLFAIFQNPGLFLLGFIWIGFHFILLITVAKIIKAPFFFVAVGSQANVGGAASAPIVASAFHPSLAAVGVLLAVLGYAVGTYAAYICGIIMQSMV